MLKIKPYTGESFPFYQEVVIAKRNTKSKPKLKDELEAISDSQCNCFEVYDEAFISNTLLTIQAEQYNDNDKNNLKELYSYRSKKIQELKNIITKHPIYSEHVLDTCQNCTINEADTMDHVLGQAEYPEFAVHPYNLFPCCSVCNKKKSDRFLDENGANIFLNLYLDDLPSSQYLHVSFDDNWMPEFRLEKPDDVSDALFNVIKSHYTQLDLLNRFKYKSNEIISCLKFTIKQFGGDGIPEKIEELCQDLEPLLGCNHRKIVLYRALGKSDDFIRECLV
ncbi:hypothetical protein [Aeromonas veronii]|uniref:hypothetical protein n=2 Tax=Aeromonas veronii TaxID=654 RepID=UPI001F354026|nr:hypothetical protein [Aeromonas veronii]MCF5843327.1 hypothetical protein [Aeromonas veronii]